MNKKINKAIKIFIVSLAMVSLLFASIVSQDEHHLESCNDECCIYCSVIHIAQSFISLIIAFFIAVVIGLFINFYLSRLHKDTLFFMQYSLVFQKVQFNE